MDWSIQDIARLAGTTSRTLRHYDDIGLLQPSRIGANGYRYYDRDALVRLQRILLLRDLGLGLAGHRRRARRTRRMRHPLCATTSRGCGTSGNGWRGRSRRSSRPSTQWREVKRSWQKTCSTDSTTPSTRRRSRSAGARRRTRASDALVAQQDARRSGGSGRSCQKRLAADWIAAAASGVAPDGDEAQALAQRHVEWLAGHPRHSRQRHGRPAAGAT